jgi:hypothetical protein
MEGPPPASWSQHYSKVMSTLSHIIWLSRAYAFLWKALDCWHVTGLHGPGCMRNGHPAGIDDVLTALRLASAEVHLRRFLNSQSDSECVEFNINSECSSRLKSNRIERMLT